jgi:hypothetical protein
MSSSSKRIDSRVGPRIGSRILGEIDIAMLKELEDILPPLNPNPEEKMEQIMDRSGQRSVVEWIRNRIKEV